MAQADLRDGNHRPAHESERFRRRQRRTEGGELQFFRLSPFYEGLRRAISDLYGTDAVNLSNDDKRRFNGVSKAFETAAGWLHKKKAFTPEMLAEPEPIALINATHDALAEELGHLERGIPEAMARALDENIFLFSGFKTYHEMNEASRLLKDEDGGFKSFDRFLQDVQAIDASYNQNWLYAEYNFATASTQMAAKWADIERDGDEYDLQYRTAMDGLVREEHAALEGITLPPSDKFWNEYYPPNGWNCRCTAVQVLKGKYPASDSDQACAAGVRATTQIGKNGHNKAAMFRFNPGKAGKVFPPKHPYYKAPDEAKKAVKATVTTMMTSNSLPEEIRIRRKEISTEAKETLRSKAFRHPKLDKDISVSGGGIDEWLNQPHKHYAEKNEMLLNIESVIEQSEYLGTTRHRGRNCHVFETELCGEKTWIIVTDVPGRGLSVYSISDGEEILKNIKKQPA